MKPPAQRNVFLSYRRADSGDITGRLYDHLARHLGGEHVFRDIDSIPLGINFRRVLDEEVGRCDVLVAVIGPSWLEITDPEGRRRLDDPDDFVRIEIEAALVGGTTVLMALVDDAAPPPAERLPASLSPLAGCPGLPLRPAAQFRDDAQQLLAVIQQAPESPRRQQLGREVWLRAVEVALRQAVWGVSIGALAGALVAGTYVVGDRLFPVRGGNHWELVMTFLPGTIGTAFVGWRRFGSAGLLGGLLVGPVVSVVLFLSTFFLFSLPTLLAQSALGTLGWMHFDRSTAIISGFAGGIAAVPTVLLVSRSQARLRARRQRVRFAPIQILLGAIAGGCLGSLAGTIVFHLCRIPEFPWLSLPVGFALTTMLLASILAATDGFLMTWRGRH